MGQAIPVAVQGGNYQYTIYRSADESSVGGIDKEGRIGNRGVSSRRLVEFFFEQSLVDR